MRVTFRGWVAIGVSAGAMAAACWQWSDALLHQEFVPSWRVDGEPLGDRSVRRAIDLGLRGYDHGGTYVFPADTYTDATVYDRNDATLAVVQPGDQQATLLPPPPAEHAVYISQALLPGGPEGQFAWIYATQQSRLMVGVVDGARWSLPPTVLSEPGSSLPAAIIAGRWDGNTQEWVLWPIMGHRPRTEDEPRGRTDLVIRRVEPDGQMADRPVPWSQMPFDYGEIVGAYHTGETWAYLISQTVGPAGSPRDETAMAVVIAPHDTLEVVREFTLPVSPPRMNYDSVSLEAWGVLTQRYTDYALTADGELVATSRCPDGDNVLPGVYRLGETGRLEMVPRCHLPNPAGTFIAATLIDGRWIGVDWVGPRLGAFDFATAAPQPVGTPQFVHDHHTYREDFTVFSDDDAVRAWSDDGHLLRYPDRKR